MKLLHKIPMAAAVFAPAKLFACAACYGRSNSALAYGMNWGIFTLMGVILTVLTCIALFFVHIVRREEAQNQDAESQNSPDA
jgi:uncharacterized membrane protein